MSEEKTVYHQNADNNKVVVERKVLEELKEKIDIISLNISSFQGLQSLFLEKVRSNSIITKTDLYNIYALIKSLADKSKEDIKEVENIVTKMFYFIEESKSFNREIRDANSTSKIIANPKK